MTALQEIKQLRAKAERMGHSLGVVLARLDQLEQRVLKDTAPGIISKQRIRFNKGPVVVRSVLQRANRELTRAQLVELIAQDYPELRDDMPYLERAVRNALQVLKQAGEVTSHTPQGRLRETVWRAQAREGSRTGEAASGGLGTDERGRVK